MHKIRQDDIMKSKYSEELAAAIFAVKEAGKLLMKNFGKESKVFAKGKHDFALKADKDAEKVIVKILKKRFPRYAVLAEESGKHGDSDYTWIIDPLDGTHNYASGVPIFGTSVALQHKNEVVIGAIYLPFLDKLLYAERGSGAFMNNKKITVKQNGRFIIFGGIHRFESRIVSRSVIKIAEKYHTRLRVIGSIVYTAAYVATGRFAGYVTFYVSPWDVAASALIVEEAGGKATDIRGRKWNPYQKHYILSNGKVHKELLRVLKQ